MNELLLYRWLRFVLLLIASWPVMSLTHELGHVVGGVCCGGVLETANLSPWGFPYSTFNPDPKPLITLWCGPLLGVFAALALALLIRRASMWFIANFCVIANGSYIATAWISGDRFLDTTRMLEHGAHPLTIALYCAVTIGFGYFAFRRSCFEALSTRRDKW